MLRPRYYPSGLGAEKSAEKLATVTGALPRADKPPLPWAKIVGSGAVVLAIFILIPKIVGTVKARIPGLPASPART